MALELNLGSDTISVICSKDSSIGITDEEERAQAHEAYLEDLDEERLNLQGEPTRFLLKRVLPYKATKQIKNEQMSYSEGKADVRMGFVLEEVRTALVGVENPGIKELEWKKDSDGYASKKLIEILDAAGIVNELFSARQHLVQGSSALAKKS